MVDHWIYSLAKYSFANNNTIFVNTNNNNNEYIVTNLMLIVKSKLNVSNNGIEYAIYVDHLLNFIPNMNNITKMTANNKLMM